MTLYRQSPGRKKCVKQLAYLKVRREFAQTLFLSLCVGVCVGMGLVCLCVLLCYFVGVYLCVCETLCVCVYVACV